MRLSREDLALQRRPRMFTLVRVQRPHPSFFGDNYYLRDEISLYFLGDFYKQIKDTTSYGEREDVY